MQNCFTILKILMGLVLALGFLGCTPREGMQRIELDKAFTTRLGYNQITPDEDFTFNVSKIITDIRNDAATVTDVQIEYASETTNGLTEFREVRAGRKEHFGTYTLNIIRVRPRYPTPSHKKYRFKIEVTRNNFLSVDCSWFYMRTEVEEVLTHKDCGTIDNTGLIRINKTTLDTIDFNQPATKWSPARLWCLPMKLSNGEKLEAYVNEKGLARSAYNHHDAGCGWFSENGLAKTYRNKRVSFFDAEMRLVYQTYYALIEGDIACSEMPEKYYPIGDEHFEWRGGACAKIDQEFVADGDMKYRFEDVPKTD